MKPIALTFLTILVALSLCATSSDESILCATVNAAQSNWVAQPNSVSRKSEHDIRAMLLPSVPIVDAPYHPSSTDKSTWDISVPPACISPVSHQEQMESAFALAALDALADRICVATKEKIVGRLSRAYVKLCMTDPQEVFKFLEQKGVVSLSCVPSQGSLTKCPTSCTDPSVVFHPFKISGLRHLNVPGAERELSTNGSLVVIFKVFSDFLNYNSGVYKHTTGTFMGHHVIRVIGMGKTDSGLQYWIARNTWGTSWGMNGDVWISKGDNGCDFEDSMFAFDPVL